MKVIRKLQAMRIDTKRGVEYAPQAVPAQQQRPASTFSTNSSASRQHPARTRRDQPKAIMSRSRHLCAANRPYLSCFNIPGCRDEYVAHIASVVFHGIHGRIHPIQMFLAHRGYALQLVRFRSRRCGEAAKCACMDTNIHAGVVYCNAGCEHLLDQMTNVDIPNYHHYSSSSSLTPFHFMSIVSAKCLIFSELLFVIFMLREDVQCLLTFTNGTAIRQSIHRGDENERV
ncbi:unnamed protein product [Anisakis simplex]|uniref:Uncharacterized protein n=1 Tax=Anisakis simplex TaxID=6269 RepID=A0A0M3IZD7_ANISI|nr:unnamed protein product [Anisakis simplex]